MKEMFRNLKFKISKRFFKNQYIKMLKDDYNNSIMDLLILLLKNWKSIFLWIVLLFEILRKSYLYNEWIPLFVLNNESILNIASYWFTIINLIIAFIIFWVFIKLIWFFKIREWKIYRFLEIVSFIISFLLLALIIIFSFNKHNWINTGSNLIYINDNYEVYNKKGKIEVFEKKTNIYYLCVKWEPYNDYCKRK